jgi:adenosine/AMP kinase
VVPVVELATRNALAIAAGHCFVIFLRDGFPVNILVAVTTLAPAAQWNGLR